MRKNLRMQLFEARTGRDIRDLIRDAVAVGGTLSAAADSMGLDVATLSRWVSDLDGTVELNYATTVTFGGYETEELPEAAVA